MLTNLYSISLCQCRRLKVTLSHACAYILPRWSWDEEPRAAIAVDPCHCSGTMTTPDTLVDFLRQKSHNINELSRAIAPLASTHANFWPAPN